LAPRDASARRLGPRPRTATTIAAPSGVIQQHDLGHRDWPFADLVVVGADDRFARSAPIDRTIARHGDAVALAPQRDERKATRRQSPAAGRRGRAHRRQLNPHRGTVFNWREWGTFRPVLTGAAAEPMSSAAHPSNEPVRQQPRLPMLDCGLSISRRLWRGTLSPSARTRPRVRRWTSGSRSSNRPPRRACCIGTIAMEAGWASGRGCSGTHVRAGNSRAEAALCASAQTARTGEGS
jgi:hypothetical protein